MAPGPRLFLVRRVSPRPLRRTAITISLRTSSVDAHPATIATDSGRGVSRQWLLVALIVLVVGAGAARVVLTLTHNGQDPLVTSLFVSLVTIAIATLSGLHMNGGR